MLNNDLRQIMRTDPFEPFQIVLVTGERFEVHHRDYLSLLAGSRSAAIHFDVRGVETVINTGLITKVEFLKNVPQRV